MMTHPGRTPTALFALGAWLACLALAMLAPQPALAAQKFENFDDDPLWEGHNNQLVSSTTRTVTQNFGYRTTNHVGLGAGEIGGIVDRSPLEPAYYAQVLAPLDFGQGLSFSGSLSLLQASHTSGFISSSDIFVGFFDSQEQGWRPPNFLGFRLRGHNEPVQNVASIELGYGTTAWAANAIDWGQTLVPNGTRHDFNVNYDPNVGNGRLTMSWDGGQILSLDLSAAHRAAGANFNRFGIFSNLLPGVTAGNRMEAYFDNVTVNGTAHNFSVDPNWDAVGNQTTFADPYLYGVNDFGYRNTSHAGGSPGEIGGLIWRVEDTEENLQAYYADDIGNFNLGDRLIASGKIAAEDFSTDAGVMLGWFNSAEQDFPPSNFVGVYMDSLSSVGRFFTPMYGTAAGTAAFAGAPFLLLPPDGQPRSWSIDYDPSGADGLGTLTVGLDGEFKTITLEPGHKAEGAAFNRFGLFNMQDNNGKHAIIYLDDISYSTRLVVPEPASWCLAVLGGLSLVAWKLRNSRSRSKLGTSFAGLPFM
jgi:hypothetical protein